LARRCLSAFAKTRISAAIENPEALERESERVTPVANSISDEVARARAFAIAAHGGQRYGDHPYSFHLDAVAGLLLPYGEEAQVIGYLHDVAEDTAVGLEGIREAFGEHVTDCVALVTDQPGANRAERKLKTNAKLAKVEGPLRVALIVKAADRLANLRMSAGGGTGSKLQMYRGEHPAFRQAAFRAGLCDELWREMDQILAGPLGR
jgi:(p)ppGpp synthase/HD superfamily hydrolase